MYALGFAIPILSFILQIWPRLSNKYFGIDTWRHLMFAEYVRKNKRLPESITDRYIVSGPFDYPPFIIIFLSLFPKKFIDNYQFLISPIFDMVSNLLIFFIALFLSKDLKTAIFAQIVAALCPLIVMEASNLSTRVLSYLIYSISFFSLLMFSYNHNPVWIVVSYLTLALLFLTHKLAIQAYLFTSIIFSLVEKNILYLFFFVGTFLSTLILFNKIYMPVLKGHIAILKYWQKNIKLRFAHQFRGLPKEDESADFIQRVYILSLKNPFVYMLGSNPWLGLFIVLFILKSLGIISLQLTLDDPMLNKFNIWIFSSLLITSFVLFIPKLRFLGEGQRYMEYAIFPLSIVLGNYFSSLMSSYTGMFMWIFSLSVILILVNIIFLQYKVIIKDRARTINQQLWKIINYLNKTGKNKVRLAIFPFNLGDAMMYFLKGKVLTSDSIVGLLQMSDVYPFVKKPMNEIIKKYNLNYIVIDQKYVQLKELRLKKYRVLIDDNSYLLIKV